MGWSGIRYLYDIEAASHQRLSCYFQGWGFIKDLVPYTFCFQDSIKPTFGHCLWWDVAGRGSECSSRTCAFHPCSGPEIGGTPLLMTLHFHRPCGNLAHPKRSKKDVYLVKMMKTWCMKELGFVQERLGGVHWNYSLYSLLRWGMVGPQAHQLSFEERLEHLEGQLGQQRWRQLHCWVSWFHSYRFLCLQWSMMTQDVHRVLREEQSGGGRRQGACRWILNLDSGMTVHPFLQHGGAVIFERIYAWWPVKCLSRALDFREPLVWLWRLCGPDFRECTSVLGF